MSGRWWRWWLERQNREEKVVIYIIRALAQRVKHQSVPPDGADIRNLIQTLHLLWGYFFVRCVHVRLASLRSQHEKNEEIKKRKDEAKWTVNSPPVVGGALNGLGWWPNQNECILYTSYPSSTFIFFSPPTFFFPAAAVVVTAEGASPRKNENKKPFRMGEYIRKMVNEAEEL